VDSDADNAREGVAEKLNLPSDHAILDRFEWLGLLSDRKLPPGVNNPLDLMVPLCVEKMKYEAGERDMVALHHIFEIEIDGNPIKATSSLVDFGIPNGQTAMAKTVSLPAAIATRMILQNKINLTGVKIPVEPQIYNPVLNELAELNIKVEEHGLDD
jgi:saccharopine dehydrogenase-like NADP-dependent oxidoreductase